MNQLKEMLEAYRNGERGLPTYDELAEVAYKEDPEISTKRAALIWADPKPPTQGVCSYHHVTAQTPFGEILITWKGWKDLPTYCVDTHPIPDYFYPGVTLEEAKAKAEKDYFDAMISEFSK